MRPHSVVIEQLKNELSVLEDQTKNLEKDRVKYDASGVHMSCQAIVDLINEIDVSTPFRDEKTGINREINEEEADKLRRSNEDRRRRFRDPDLETADDGSPHVGRGSTRPVFGSDDPRSASEHPDPRLQPGSQQPHVAPSSQQPTPTPPNTTPNPVPPTGKPVGKG